MNSRYQFSSQHYVKQATTGSFAPVCDATARKGSWDDFESDFALSCSTRPSASASGIPSLDGTAFALAPSSPTKPTAAFSSFLPRVLSNDRVITSSSSPAHPSSSQQQRGDEVSAGKKNKSFEGRRGDPRMHAAVALRLASPSMPLIDALVQGGFVFPTLGESGANDRNTLDNDGVLLYQRKNQLNRRLRLAKRKDPKSKSKSEHGKASKVAKVSPPKKLNPRKSHKKQQAHDDALDDFLGFLDAEVSSSACANLTGNLFKSVVGDNATPKQSMSSYQEALDPLLSEADPIPL